jgi:hypothetical protein
LLTSTQANLSINIELYVEVITISIGFLQVFF